MGLTCSVLSDSALTPEELTPQLLFFTESGNLAALNTLLKSNPDLNTPLNKRGDTALLIATRNGHDHIVAALIAAGANVRAINKKKQTAFYLACKLRHKEIAFQFLNTVTFKKMKAIHNSLTKDFIIEYKKQVTYFRMNMFTVLLAVQRSRLEQNNDAQMAVLPTHPSSYLVSNPVLYPEWYRPLIQSDIRIMLKRIHEMLTKNNTVSNPSPPTPIIFSAKLRVKTIDENLQTLTLEASPANMPIQTSKKITLIG